MQQRYVTGTGIVTSVPSDSPDDYAALRDVKSKKVSVAGLFVAQKFFYVIHSTALLFTSQGKHIMLPAVITRTFLTATFPNEGF